MEEEKGNVLKMSAPAIGTGVNALGEHAGRKRAAREQTSRMLPWVYMLRIVRMCGSVLGRETRRLPRGGPTPADEALQDYGLVAHGRSHGTIAPSCLVRRCPHGGPLFASSRWSLMRM